MAANSGLYGYILKELLFRMNNKEIQYCLMTDVTLL